MAILIGTSAPVSIKSLQFIKLLLPVCPMLTAPSRCEVPCELKTCSMLGPPRFLLGVFWLENFDLHHPCTSMMLISLCFEAVIRDSAWTLQLGPCDYCLTLILPPGSGSFRAYTRFHRFYFRCKFCMFQHPLLEIETQPGGGGSRGLFQTFCVCFFHTKQIWLFTVCILKVSVVIKVLTNNYSRSPTYVLVSTYIEIKPILRKHTIKYDLTLFILNFSQ